MKRTAVLALLILLVCASIFLFRDVIIPKKPEIRPVPKVTPSLPAPEYKVQFSGTKLAAISRNRRIWQMSCRKVEGIAADNTAMAHDISGTFYRNGKSVMSVKADRARINLTNKDVDFFGPVSARTVRGDAAKFRSLRWDGKRELLLEKERVEITKKKIRISGRRMEADPSLSEVKIEGRVRIIIP